MLRVLKLGCHVVSSPSLSHRSVSFRDTTTILLIKHTFIRALFNSLHTAFNCVAIATLYTRQTFPVCYYTSEFCNAFGGTNVHVLSCNYSDVTVHVH